MFSAHDLPVPSHVNAGAFDCFGLNRPQLLANLERVLIAARRVQQNRETGNSAFLIPASSTETPGLTTI